MARNYLQTNEVLFLRVLSSFDDGERYWPVCAILRAPRKDQPNHCPIHYAFLSPCGSGDWWKAVTATTGLRRPAAGALRADEAGASISLQEPNVGGDEVPDLR
jgi:hypothetical protein